MQFLIEKQRLHHTLENINTEVIWMAEIRFLIIDFLSSCSSSCKPFGLMETLGKGISSRLETFLEHPSIHPFFHSSMFSILSSFPSSGMEIFTGDCCLATDMIKGFTSLLDLIEEKSIFSHWIVWMADMTTSVVQGVPLSCCFYIFPLISFKAAPLSVFLQSSSSFQLPTRSLKTSLLHSVSSLWFKQASSLEGKKKTSIHFSSNHLLCSFQQTS